MKKLILFFSLLIFHYSLSIAEIRYVSHSGSNTPPYLTWETAADSIMSAINVSTFGDTIYVANGVYEEQVVMIPGLSLIGAGMDSCVIDTRDLVTSSSDISVEMADSCLLRGFQLIVANNTMLGWGISGRGSSETMVEFNKVVNAKFGILLDATFFEPANMTIYNNICANVSIGIELFNSNSLIRKNVISTDPNSQSAGVFGVRLGAFDFTYTPVIDSNTVITNGVHLYSTIHMGIYKSFGTKPVITNNIILLNGEKTTGMTLSYSDSGKVFNNLIVADSYYDGISNTGIHYLKLYNNYIAGNPHHQATNHYAIEIGPDNEVKNNVVSNAENGIGTWESGNLIVQYNNLWNNEVNYLGFTGDTTNISVDPMVVNDDTTQGDLDFHLQKYSPLIDAGDPSITDRDGSRSDIGLYGGPYGWTYTYQDLAPRPPHNITAVIEEGLVRLNWNRNTEADFSHYRLYRDTVSNFIYDTTKIIGETADTLYYDNLPVVNGGKNYYYLITAFDNQGNQSCPGEEVIVEVTGLTEHPPIGSDGYRLLSNYPNPFNPSTIIPYRLKEGGYVKLYIYDIKGELVTTLVNQWQTKGYYEVVFRPTAEQRQRATGMEVPMGPTLSDMASGVYLYQIMVTSEKNIPVFSDMGKMILLK